MKVTSQSKNLTQFSLNRRITVLMIFLSVTVVGIIAAIGLPLELMPRGFEAKTLQVSVPWMNAPTREVFEKVVQPMEEELSTIRGLNHVTSYSQKGNASITLSFKQNIDMNVAYRETRDRVERARPLMPDGVDRIFIRKEDLSGFPVAILGLAIDPSVADPYTLVKKQVIARFERLDGVAKIDAHGIAENEIIIEVDRDLAEGYGLNIFELSQELGGDNFTMASGHVRDADKKFFLRSVATYDNIDALRNRLVAPNVRLSDIADIRYEPLDFRFSVRVDSKPAVALFITKEGDANTVEVSKRIKAELLALKADPRLASVDIEPLIIQGDLIQESLEALFSGGRIGGIFAIMVLFFFLRRFRLTLIITLSIPVSLLIALIGIYFLNETLNILTILGLMICVGLLVDNSVVVAENIHRLHREGLPRRQACVQGANEIALAIVMATLTTVIVFLPAALIEGQIQFFLIRLALPITISLLASLMVALVFIPLCVYITLPSTTKVKDTAFRRLHQRINDVLRVAYDLSFLRINHLYARMLGFFLKHRADLLVGTLLLSIFTAQFGLKKVKMVFKQEEDKTSIRINVDAAPEINYEDLLGYFRDVEKVLESKKEIYQLEGYLVICFNGGGSLTLWKDRKAKHKLSTKKVAEEMIAAIPKRAGIELFYGSESQATSDEPQAELFTVRLQGEDPLLLDQAVEDLKPLILAVDGVLGMQQGNSRPPNELALVVDRERASNADVNSQTIAGVVGTAIAGRALPRYNENGREIPVRIRFEEEDRESLTELGEFAVPNQSGGVLTVNSLTNRELVRSAPGIYRHDKQMNRTINFELTDDNAQDTRGKLNAILKNIDLPEGIRVAQGLSFRETNEFTDLGLAFLMSVFFIYLLMGFLFESFALPLSIIFTIPLAGIGAVWIHVITGVGLDMLGGVGVILLVGVVVNNGIVLIDYVNRLREEGMDRTAALIQAAEHRFRPIVMTAITTIIGMIPVVLSKPSTNAISYKSFGLTLIGGMTTGTLLTLLVIPILYTLFDDLRVHLEATTHAVTDRKGEQTQLQES